MNQRVNNDGVVRTKARLQYLKKLLKNMTYNGRIGFAQSFGRVLRHRLQNIVRQLLTVSEWRVCPPGQSEHLCAKNQRSGYTRVPVSPEVRNRLFQELQSLFCSSPLRYQHRERLQAKGKSCMFLAVH